MISNYISYAISLVEILFIGGAVWGWGFMQYMMEKEYVFYESHCLEDCLAACEPQNTSKLTASSWSDPARYSEPCQCNNNIHDLPLITRI